MPPRVVQAALCCCIRCCVCLVSQHSSTLLLGTQHCGPAAIASLPFWGGYSSPVEAQGDFPVLGHSGTQHD